MSESFGGGNGNFIFFVLTLRAFGSACGVNGVPC